ncbi:hypothetical protein ACFWB2_31875 [Streptomyces virginiae]|uniref:hypothetical protein n=1 Tax=Streptomyces virginiae TaxID=1961 RepID=UPI0036AFABB0
MSITTALRAVAQRVLDRTAKQAPEVLTDLPPVAEIEQAARDLTKGRGLLSEGRALESRAKKVLASVPDGTYGSAVISRKGNTPVLDQRAARKLLEAEGIAVPMMDRAATVVASFTEATAEFSGPMPAEEEEEEEEEESLVADLLADLDAKLAALAAA